MPLSSPEEVAIDLFIGYFGILNNKVSHLKYNWKIKFLLFERSEMSVSSG